MRTNDLKRIQRIAFWSVIEAYNNARSVMGQAPAMDCSRITGGQGAQFDKSSGQSTFKLIDFTVDVVDTIKSNSNKQEFVFFKENIEDKSSDPADFKVQSESFMEMQYRIGRAFIGRNLYPVRRYFNVIKK